MKLLVLVGQRKCDYPGQYALEALACMDDVGNSDNPEYLEGEHASHEKSGEFDRLGVVTLTFSEQDVLRVLYPERQEIAAAVVQAE